MPLRRCGSWKPSRKWLAGACKVAAYFTVILSCSFIIRIAPLPQQVAGPVLVIAPLFLACGIAVFVAAKLHRRVRCPRVRRGKQGQFRRAPQFAHSFTESDNSLKQALLTSEANQSVNQAGFEAMHPRETRAREPDSAPEIYSAVPDADHVDRVTVAAYSVLQCLDER